MQTLVKNEDIEKIRLFICKAQEILGVDGDKMDAWAELDKARGVIFEIQKDSAIEEAALNRAWQDMLHSKETPKDADKYVTKLEELVKIPPIKHQNKCPDRIPVELINRIYHAGQDNKEALIEILDMLMYYGDEEAYTFKVSKKSELKQSARALKAKLEGKR